MTKPYEFKRWLRAHPKRTMLCKLSKWSKNTCIMWKEICGLCMICHKSWWFHIKLQKHPFCPQPANSIILKSRKHLSATLKETLSFQNQPISNHDVHICNMNAAEITSETAVLHPTLAYITNQRQWSACLSLPLATPKSLSLAHYWLWLWYLAKMDPASNKTSWISSIITAITE